MVIKTKIVVFVLLTLLFLGNSYAGTDSMPVGNQPGTLENPIIDSDMSLAEALDKKIPPLAPLHILSRQVLVDVLYYAFDNKIHKGQIVIDKELANDVREIFLTALQEKFPIFSVIPISHPQFQWDDNKSMAANNTSAFNYRHTVDSNVLSKHAYGFAIDINPSYNPYIKGSKVLPPGARYIPARPGTLTPDSLVVKTFLRLGWSWGGNYKTLKDYQHFSKKP